MICVRASGGAFVLLILFSISNATETPILYPKRVLILHSHSRALPITLDWERGIATGLESNIRGPVAIDVEYLAFERLLAHSDRDAWINLLRRKYADSQPDVIVTVNNAAAECIARLYPDLFPEAAVVFCSINEQLLSHITLTPRMTGVAYRMDYQATLETACKLFPETQKVIVVSGLGEDDTAMRAQAKVAFTRQSRIQTMFWTGMPVHELCDRLSKLKSGTIVLFLSHERDVEGRVTVSPRDVARRISESCSVPVFGLYDTLMETGILGGHLGMVEQQGERAGTLAARVMQGESPSAIPFSGTEMNRMMFDWRQMRRWGISEQNLPLGSAVMFREPTIWGRYWIYITFTIVAIAGQSLLILGLLVNRWKRWRAEGTLAAQLNFEKMLSDVASHLVGITTGSVTSEIEKALACAVEQLGVDRCSLFRLSENGRELVTDLTYVRAGEQKPPGVVALDSIPWLWARLLQGDVVQISSMSKLPKEAFRERELADHLGVKSIAAVAFLQRGKISGMLTFGMRTREQSWDLRVLQRIRLFSEMIGNALSQIHTNEALAASRSETRKLAGRILTAQEDERKRIARELHDDISQRLAVGAIEAGKAERELSVEEHTRAALSGLKKHLVALADDVHRLSRQLHPAILDDLGLVDAVRAECERLKERAGVAVNFRSTQLPASLPKDLALCVYRIAQETLQNIAKHAAADQIGITLSADLEFLDMDIQDNGRGFEPDAVRRGLGIGLASIEERVHLVGGEISIWSSPGQGTRIHVRVPLPQEPQGLEPTDPVNKN